ncbi:efflux RND transporter permease subunit [Xanthobacter autotrophicus]|uniref:efflux RND transporter permease subunit n=1 Tax=Xanthobacter autotrophicus TaxID=280 RepID=UPI003736103D
MHNVDEFRNLIVKEANGAIVRLKDVANVTLGADDYESATMFNGRESVYIGIQIAPAAAFVNSSIEEVIHTLVEALAIVTLMVFAFLGSWRSVLIPVFAIPLIFLSLAALFNSFRDPVVILLSVPMSLAGALLFISVGIHADRPGDGFGAPAQAVGRGCPGQARA